MSSLRRDAKLALLQGVQLFAGFSKKALAAVAKAAEQVDDPDGVYLGRQDAVGHEAFVVVSGSLTVAATDARSPASRQGTSQGDAHFDGQRNSAALVASGETSVLVIPRREFLTLLDGNAALSQKLLRTLADRLREADRALYG